MNSEQEWNNNKNRFCSLWISQQVDPEDTTHVESVWQIISDKYAEPSRHYHTKTHILDCLKQLDSAKHQVPDFKAVELATWFHDAVYDPTAKDNEAQSVVLFKKLADGILPEELIQKVSDLIIATLHIDQPADLDQAFMLDIDLSSIAGTWQRFTRDNSDLRKEVKHLDCKEYCQKKIGFFKMLLDKERIFFTDFFHEACEQKARLNMENFIRFQALTEKCNC